MFYNARCISRRSNCRLLCFDSSSASHARPGSGCFTMPGALAVVAIVGYYTLIVVPRHMLVRALDVLPGVCAFGRLLPSSLCLWLAVTVFEWYVG